jgi:mono/diheme cytochrome c family protein
MVVLLVTLVGAVVWLDSSGEDEPTEDAVASGRPGPATIERGAYLARAGNCIGCHTARGGADYAGGRAIDTPFGTVFSPNLTPDPETGIGRWSTSDFWRAMHYGRSKDGRSLYPAFPYPSYTQVTRADSDAIHAYLTSLPPVNQPNTPHALRWPYRLQASLAVWRALYFSPGRFDADPAQSEDWNRGRYLVEGLGHCAACHAARNVLGATSDAIGLRGGLIPMQNWYAPSLVSAQEAGVGEWPLEDVVSLLKAGVSSHASVMGPMAEVVYRSTQYLTEADLAAMAVFLKSRQQAEPDADRVALPASDASAMSLGEKVYSDRCAECHGDRGQGVAGIYPALAGNRASTLSTPVNVLKAILDGGFPPATAGNPRPFGMPPFRQILNDSEVAAVATYVRRSWGNAASAVASVEAARAR